MMSAWMWLKIGAKSEETWGWPAEHAVLGVYHVNANPWTSATDDWNSPMLFKIFWIDRTSCKELPEILSVFFMSL